MKPDSFPPTYKFKKLNLKKRGPPPLVNLIYSAENVEELKQLFAGITERDRRRIKEKTKDQSHSPHWFLYRKCCVTGTLAKRIVSAIQHQKPSIPLNKAISKFGQGNFSNEAMKYGLDNEKNGIDALWKEFKKAHKTPKLHKTGICIHKNLPFLAGTPDCILSCENCCSSEVKYFIGEIKCPFRLRDSGIGGWKTLEYLTENSELKQSHPYYFQQTLYCGLNNASLCYFVIWAPDGNIILEIKFDKDLYNLIESSAEKYFYEYYAPQFYRK